MPASNPPIRAHPAKPFRTMKDAARSHQVLTLRCNLCRRRVSYLASDLVEIVGADWPVHIPPFACHKDGSEYVQVEVWNPRAEDIGRVPVRRPGRVIQTWQTVMLGD
ncbi:hypothetical protein [uncultured Ruegeria sp.]|uniref:hypothetical protein n=1 Tax=uncultured Ruegeria sp. TaxID=259304 RepID=UPI002639E897|nr:hypothetical protein [uncultured Ruegeria sp.]